MFAAGAQRLADYVSKEEIDAGNLYPQLCDLRDISLKVPFHPMLDSCPRLCQQPTFIVDSLPCGLARRTGSSLQCTPGRFMGLLMAYCTPLDPICLCAE